MNRSLALALAVAAALLLNPVWLFPGAADDYVYRTEPLAMTDGTGDLVFAGSLSGPVVGVDCDDDPGRACAVEARHAVEGNTSRGPPAGLVAGADETYLFAGKAGYYRRTDVVAPGAAAYSWEPVSRAEVVRGVAVAPESLPPDVARAVRDGDRVTRREPIPPTPWSDPDESWVVGPIDEGAEYRLLTVRTRPAVPSTVAAVVRVLLGVLGVGVVVGERLSLGSHLRSRLGVRPPWL